MKDILGETNEDKDIIQNQENQLKEKEAELEN